MEKVANIEEEIISLLDKESAKGLNPFADFSCCIFKKCCKKYKKGKRCKKCPDQ